MYFAYILLGLAVGVLVGFMGVGGGVILVPAMVYSSVPEPAHVAGDIPISATTATRPWRTADV